MFSIRCTRAWPETRETRGKTASTVKSSCISPPSLPAPANNSAGGMPELKATSTTPNSPKSDVRRANGLT